jgi:hypothetical protein
MSLTTIAEPFVSAKAWIVAVNCEEAAVVIRLCTVATRFSGATAAATIDVVAVEITESSETEEVVPSAATIVALTAFSETAAPGAAFSTLVAAVCVLELFSALVELAANAVKEVDTHKIAASPKAIIFFFI